MTSRVLLLFIDGLGIGRRDEHNPLTKIAGDNAIAWFDDSVSHSTANFSFVRTDPRLGVEGRPQSASGQTTILTGINAPKKLGYHKQGFPNRAMREIIGEHSLFLQLQRLGIDETVFANTYTPRFFESPPRWKSASTCAVEAAGMQFKRMPDLIRGFGVFHDFTNKFLADSGYDVPVLSATEAAANLSRIASQHRFTFYEHFITDKIGHDRDLEMADVHLPKLSEFVHETVRLSDLADTTVILISDHGNVEDLSIRNHTLNDVPTVIWGRFHAETVAKITDLTHITPAIIDLLTERR